MALEETQPEIVLDAEVGEVCISYSPRTEKAIYDVCDFEGRIMLTGTLAEHETRIPFGQLGKGRIFLLCIVDGDEIYKVRVNLNRMQPS